MILQSVMLLLVVYQVKHFLADYPLQGQYMLRKFSSDFRVWVPALSAHAGVHALFTLFIAFWWLGASHSGGLPFALAFFDFVVHFVMDRIKASPDLLGRFKSISALEFPLVMQGAKAGNTVYIRRLRGNTLFWWSLGFDQMVHHLTHYLIIACLVSH